MYFIDGWWCLNDHKLTMKKQLYNASVIIQLLIHDQCLNCYASAINKIHTLPQPVDVSRAKKS